MSKIEADINENTTDFREIWKRVSGESEAEQSEPFESRLESLIGMTAETAAYTAALARMFVNPGRSTLQAQANVLRGHLKQLRTEYFLRTGDRILPKAMPPAVTGKPASLRILYKMNESNVAGFLQAAQTAPADMAAALHRYAADSKRHCAELRQLLSECI